ncbi:MAG: hypothetical protein MUC81_01395 [Bacteroidia bacterium]|jgi:hypothetical protein|nr:hypothetical protein [Bacteroidia bacterium]
MRLIILTVLTLTFSIAIGQVNIVADGYYDKIKNGYYINQSTDSVRLHAVKNIITPQTTIPLLDDKTALVFPPAQGLLLFSDLKDKSNPSKLTKPTLIQIDTVFYNQMYQSDSGALISFDVWYAFKINGATYYMDYQPQDFLAFQYKLPDHKQLFTIYGQSTGYDYSYDNGYPNNFHVVVFSINNHMMTMYYCSSKLPLDYEDEFWELKSSMKYQYIGNKKTLEFEIYGKPNYKAVWTGKILTQK